MPPPWMRQGTEHELTGARRATVGRVSPLLRRVLWGMGTALAFLVLALLGLGVASLFFLGGPTRPEPEPVPAAPPSPRPVAERPPAPPPPAPPPAPAPAAALPPPPPPPAPVAVPEQRPLVPGNPLPVTARLRARRELIRGLGALKDELARCPSDPVARSSPGSRAALVLHGVTESGALRVVGSQLEAEEAVNDRFVSCARSVLEGKQLPFTAATEGRQLQIFLPLSPNGNSLSLPALSVTQTEAEPE